MDQIPVTTQGFAALKKELEKLKTVDRPEIIKAIEVARAHGDLSENAEYHAAKERQSFIEGRIGELSYKIGNAKVIDPASVTKDVGPVCQPRSCGESGHRRRAGIHDCR